MENTIQIKQDKCIVCKTCIEICPNGILELVEERLAMREE